MTRPKVLAIGLDGIEISFVEELVAQGMLPTLARQRKHDAHLLLEHGPAARTGLGWEHFWSGLDPEAAHRETPIEFDPATYQAWQEGARFDPFFRSLGKQAVVFDACYADISRAPEVDGVVNWGSHDPGLSTTMSNPPTLIDELTAHVGDYPAQEWIYASPWASVADTEAMGKGLVSGIEARAAAARWLLNERFPDWELGLIVVSEPHSAHEALWHGVDEAHPLHHHPSAPAARDSLIAVYEAVDRLVGELVAATGATTVIVFAIGGMGINDSDVTSMALLPELVHRWATGRAVLQVPPEWAAAPGVAPDPGAGRPWDRAWFGAPERVVVPTSPVHRVVGALPAPARDWIRNKRSTKRAGSRPTGYRSLDWQPANWYQPRWSEMRAFALPSLYDGRIRVNLRGREANGMVDPGDSGRVCHELEQLVRDCVDPATGETVVADVERPGAGIDPLALGSGVADLVVVWGRPACALQHPQHGLIGPLPYRRTGGHTNPYGYASVSGPGIADGEHGVASSFDVAPTIVDLLGGRVEGLSGSSFLPRIRRPGG
jgi:predicted AlkP superfamily phosphohydrolase/phosphomutase